MPTPTLITELSTTAAANAPAGSDSPSTLDDIQRAHASFIAQLRDADALKLNASAVSAFGLMLIDDASAAAARATLEVTPANIGAAASGANTDITSITGNAATATLAATATKLSSDTGSAPSHSCRAWVNFNGTGTVAIRASGNVSSITDSGVGSYLVNFITPMPDANYAVVGATQGSAIGVLPVISSNQEGAQTASQTKIYTTTGTAATATDMSFVAVAVFR